MIRLFCFSCLISFVICGCSSVTSQLVTRDESNMNWQVQHLKGIPITLKVPTHVRLSMIETNFITKTADPVSSKIVGREVQHELISTNKVFTVDPKRPASGIGKFTATFNDNQYLQAMGSEIQDTTIREVSLAFERILPLLPARTAEAKMLPGAEYTPVKSVVAVGIFEIDDPLFEENVQNFLAVHVNNCHCPPENCPEKKQKTTDRADQWKSIPEASSGYVPAPPATSSTILRIQ